MTHNDISPSQPDPSQFAEPRVQLDYVPKPGLGGLAIKNFLLTVITLGIYSFWAKTHVRRHIWSCVHVMDEPLEYTGTGKELFLGMLVILGIVVLPLYVIQTAVQFIFPGNPVVFASVQIALVVLVLYLIGVAIYRARRYRLSRTIWRGIRGTLTGSPWVYAWRNFWMTLLLPLTLLWSYPWMRVQLNSQIMNETQIGSESFRFDGRSGPLYGRYAVLWILSLVLLVIGSGLYTALTVGLGLAAASSETPMTPEAIAIATVAGVVLVLPLFALVTAIFRAIYVSAELNYFAKCTGFEGARFAMNATPLSLIGLAIGNFFILVLTLTIAAPFVQQRLVRYVCDRTTISGAVDVAAIQQSQAELDKRGEGLAEVFDIDAF
ncbi:MAG: YjgN family protein [Hyphomicrobiales bacterium]